MIYGSPVNLTNVSFVAAGFAAIDAMFVEGAFVGHSLGGSAANVAGAWAWWGHPSILFARIGEDKAGARLQFELEDMGVIPTRLLPSGETPIVIEDLQDGRHRFLSRCPVCRRSLPKRTRLDRKCTLGVSPKVLFFDRADPAIKSAVSGSPDSLSFADPPSWGKGWASLVKGAKIVKYSAETMDKHCPQGVFAAGLIGPELEIRTDGNRPVMWRRPTGRWRKIPVPRIQSVDTTGAGDWFSAALIVELLERDLSDDDVISAAVISAVAWAAISTQFIGAQGLARSMDVRQAIDMVNGDLESNTPPPLPDELSLPTDWRDCPVCFRPVLLDSLA